MIFQNNVVQHYLKNVYFISGTACGGKTSVSRALGKKYGIQVYDVDAMFPVHQQMSDKDNQPEMNHIFGNADEFFGRSVEEYKNWLIKNTREQLDFVLLDLIRLSQEKRIICDCHITAREADMITEPSRCIFLTNDTSDIIGEYCRRPDHQDFKEFINSASDSGKAKAVCNETLYKLSTERINDIKNSGYLMLERSSKRSIEETVQLAVQHFGW